MRTRIFILKTKNNMRIGKYSFGIGDRFGCQGEAQLKSIMKAKQAGIDITPVWNKSNREHATIHSEPIDTREEADTAIKAQNWKGEYHVDADHINLNTVEKYLDVADFFTLDVADYIGKQPDADDLREFMRRNKKYEGEFLIPGIEEPVLLNEIRLQEIAYKFLFATKEASNIYNYIKKNKGADNFISEVSMDEVKDPQTPVELFFILSMLSQFGVPAQTIAPKFTGRFNKGVDYAGDVEQFKKEFEEDLLVIDFAIKEFGLPDNLKLSVHSGSDKFTIYPVMGELIKKHDKGIHVKTAGTTWLEEMIGLALSGDEALTLAKNIYRKGYERRDELCRPYATVIDIDESKLPQPDEVDDWTGEKFANSLRHLPDHPEYNPNVRQLIHVSYKVAAEYSNVYINMVQTNSEIVGQQVTENIFDRHIRRLFHL